MAENRQSVIIEAVSNDRTHVVDKSGAVFPVRTMIDKFGEETDSPQDAATLIAEMASGHWAVIDLSDFEKKLPH